MKQATLKCDNLEEPELLIATNLRKAMACVTQVGRPERVVISMAHLPVSSPERSLVIHALISGDDSDRCAIDIPPVSYLGVLGKKK